MISLIAADFANGWAFVQREGEILLIHPPYHRTSLSIVSNEILQKAVATYGFTATDECFECWDAVIDYLKGKLVDYHKALGYGEPDSDTIAEMLQYAPPEILEEYLGRITAEMFPNREFKPAIQLLKRMISLEGIQNNPTLLSKIVALLAECVGRMELEDIKKEGLLTDEDSLKEFPEAIRQWEPSAINSYRRQVQERRTMWC